MLQRSVFPLNIRNLPEGIGNALQNGAGKVRPVVPLGHARKYPSGLRVKYRRALPVKIRQIDQTCTSRRDGGGHIVERRQVRDTKKPLYPADRAAGGLHDAIDGGGFSVKVHDVKQAALRIDDRRIGDPCDPRGGTQIQIGVAAVHISRSRAAAGSVAASGDHGHTAGDAKLPGAVRRDCANDIAAAVQCGKLVHIQA